MQPQPPSRLKRLVARLLPLAVVGGVAYCLAPSKPPEWPPKAAAEAPPARSVYSWGLNHAGQLGVGTVKAAPLPTRLETLDSSRFDIVRVCASGLSSAALDSRGQLYTWGCGGNGRLGHADESDRLIPQRVETPLPLRDVALGEYHLAAVDVEGGLWTVGRGRGGQLGHGEARDALALRKVAGLEGKRAVQIAAGEAHTAVLTEDGEVYTFGSGFGGGLGHGERKDATAPRRVEALAGKRVRSVACGRDVSFFVTDDGIYACGSDDFGQLGLGKHERTVRVPLPIRNLGDLAVAQVAAGDFHAAAVTRDGALYTWGWNKEGNLGQGDTADQSLPRRLEGLPRIAKVACGGGHTAALSEAGELFVFGRGRDGQLGRGDLLESIAAYRTTPVRVEALKGKAVVDVACGRDHTLALAAERR
eukprot:tig00021318_g20183.t1